jgi:hypothetical protein
VGRGCRHAELVERPQLDGDSLPTDDVIIDIPAGAFTVTSSESVTINSLTNGLTANDTANNMNQYSAAGGSTYCSDADGNLTEQTNVAGTTRYIG